MNKLIIDDGWILFEEQFYTQKESAVLYDELLKTLNWSQGEITLFGKHYPTPRLEAFYADENLNYSYSGQHLVRQDFNSILLEIKNKLEKKSGFTFNSVLANYYRDGLDSNGWHADNEKELGKNPLIASLSFGAERRFDLKHSTSIKRLHLPLKEGSLLIMGGEIQHHWKHQIAKSKRINSGRINLTFRTIL